MESINFNGINEYSGFPVAEEGDYVLKITEIKQEEWNDKKVYKITTEILFGEFAGTRIYADLWLTAKNMPYVKLFFSTCGFDVSGVVNFELEDLIDKKFGASVIIKQYEHNRRTKQKNTIEYGRIWKIKEEEFNKENEKENDDLHSLF